MKQNKIVGFENIHKAILHADQKMDTKFSQLNMGFIFISIFLLGFLSFGALDPLATFGDDYLTYLDGMYMESKGYELGRWGVVLIWSIFADNSFLSPVSLYIGIAFIAFAGFLMAKTFGIKSRIDILLIAGLFVTTPFLFDILAVKMRHFTTTFGVMIPVIAAYLFYSKKNSILTINAIIVAIIALSLAIYPSNISILVLIFVAVELKFMAQSNTLRWNSFFKIATLLILGLFLYLLSLLALKYTGNGPKGGINGYSTTSGFVDSWPAFIKSFQETYRIFINYLFYENNAIPLVYSWFLMGLTLLSVAIYYIKSKNSIQYKVLFTLVAMLLPAIALAITLPKISWPHRYSIYVPMSLIPVIATAIGLCLLDGHKTILRPLIRVSIALSIAIIVLSNAMTVYESNRKWQETLMFGNRVLGDIENTSFYINKRKSGAITQVEGFHVIRKKANTKKRASRYRNIGSSLHECHLIDNCQKHRLAALLNRIKGRKLFGGYNMFKSPFSGGINPADLPDKLVYEEDGRIVVIIH